MRRLISFLFLLINFNLLIEASIRVNLRKIAEEVNSDPESTWKADSYGFEEVDIHEFAKLKLGLRLPDKYFDIPYFSNDNPTLINLSKLKRFRGRTAKNLDDEKFGSSSIALPQSYDARKRYPECYSIRHIRDQSNCGSCWAVSSAAAFSDRICIHSKGKYNISLSSQFVMSCNKENYGCEGGYLDEVWDFFEETGVVTGGDFESDDGCQPYLIPPCGYPRKMPCALPSAITPKCRGLTCSNEWYGSQNETTIFRTKDSYQVGHMLYLWFNEYVIRKEIYENGPIVAGFFVYPDFFSYKTGVYKHKYKLFERPVGGHAVKVMGWGVEDGQKYWLVANSWAENWGINGTFKIVRGENNCLFENEMYAGIPKL